MSGLVETLTTLVDIRSVVGDEGRLCTALATRLLPSWGQQHVQRVGNSLVVGQRTGRPMLLLVGHIDTVPEQGQSEAHLADGRLHGLGASDMKAGISIMVHLLEDPAVRMGPYDVVGVFYDKEEGPADENGLEPVLQDMDWLSEAQFAVVLEPTDLEVQLGCLGVINATIRFLGRSAHSARPWLGENAVTKAGAWLDALHRMEPRPVTVAGLEFKEVFSVTGASGGVARNVVPPSFDVDLNYRFPPGYSLEEAEQRLRGVAADGDELVIVDRAPAAPIPDDNVHLDRLLAVTGAARTSKQAWTDVARLAAHGIPAVNYGPGETAQAHQVDESVPVANLDIGFQALRSFLTAE